MTVSPPPPVSQNTPLARLLRTHRDQITDAWWRSQFAPDLIRRYAVAGVEEVSPQTLRDGFVRPLLDLLLTYLETGSAEYRDVYLDERLRYAPHQADPGVRAEFFRLVLAQDADALAAALGPAASAPDFRPLWDELHAPLLAAGGTPLRLLTLGDCLMNEIRVFLTGASRRAGIELDYRGLYFSASMGRALPADQAIAFLADFPADLIALSFLSYAGIPPYTALLREADRLPRREAAARADAIVVLIRHFVERLRQETDAPFLIHNTSGLPLTRLRRHLPLPAQSRARSEVLRRLNAGIEELCGHTRNAILIDEAAVARREGHRACGRTVISHRISRKAFFHTSRFGALLTPPYLEVLETYRTLRKAKVLLVDFDNTLWDGVMADGPVVQHPERQRLLRRLREAGLLLVALSKNDPANIRWDELELAPEDFVLHKISWQLKVESVAQAAQELNLGRDSFVLVDDNPAERELIRGQFPDIPALDPTQPDSWRRLRLLLDFPNTQDTPEARERTAMYRAQARRQEALAAPVDYPGMMRSLGLVAAVRQAEPADLPRLVELAQRTNQFNTTTMRYTRQELQARLAAPDSRVYAGSLRDKFGNLGVVGLVVVERGPEESTISAVVMSCRAMGFDFERLLLHTAVAGEESGRPVVGRFVPSARNQPAAQLFPENGFVPRGPQEWVLPPTAPRPARPDWFATG